MIRINLTLTPNLTFLHSVLKHNYDSPAHLSEQLRIPWVSSYKHKRVNFSSRPSSVVKKSFALHRPGAVKGVVEALDHGMTLHIIQHVAERSDPLFDLAGFKGFFQ
jgi:hypothetical protein